MNNIVLFMRGPDDGWLRAKFREEAAFDLFDVPRDACARCCPSGSYPGWPSCWSEHGVDKERRRQRAKTCLFDFEPGDIVSEVMSFGSPNADRDRRGQPQPARRASARRSGPRDEMKKIPCLRDVQFQQTLEYPTVEVNIDREKAGLSGVTAQQVGNGVIVATSSSRFIALNYWQNPKTGFDYQVEVLVPTQRMTSSDQVETLPIDPG